MIVDAEMWVTLYCSSHIRYTAVAEELAGGATYQLRCTSFAVDGEKRDKLSFGCSPKTFRLYLPLKRNVVHETTPSPSLIFHSSLFQRFTFELATAVVILNYTRAG